MTAKLILNRSLPYFNAILDNDFEAARAVAAVEFEASEAADHIEFIDALEAKSQEE